LSLDPQKKHYAQQKHDLEQKLAYLRPDLDNTKRQINSTKASIARAENVLREKDNAVQKVDLRQAEIDKAIFKEFCERAHVEDIREFEVTRLQTFEERYAKRLQLQSRLSQLVNFIETEQRMQTAKTPEKLEDDRGRLHSELEETVRALDVLDQDFNALSSQLEEAKTIKLRWQGSDDSNALELKDLRRVLQRKNEELEETNDRASAAEHDRDLLMQTLTSVFQQCRLANIQLPKDEDSAPVDGTPSSFTQEMLDLSELDRIDFSGLPVAQRVKLSPSKFEESVRRYESELNHMKSELAQARPDLKSTQRYQDVETELAKMQEEQDQLRTRAGELKREFAEVKQRRRDLFMGLYDAIDRTIDSVYKRLTRVRDQGNRSGTAYLALEDTEEPYLGGVKFTAMPPHKRFRDLEQLSGGEKAVASLALIIALQKQLRAPFVLMDEPDASLDKLNLKAAATALRDMAAESQIVSVSLRDRFFEYADVLVGVYKDGQSSGIATLNLQNFAQPSLVMEPLD
jgi:structural maintenance of chromosome 1